MSSEIDHVHGTVALALIVALLRELHHEKVLDEERFVRMLRSTPGVLRALLALRRDFVPTCRDGDDTIDIDALLRNMELSTAWTEERDLEALIKAIETTFLNLPPET